MLSEYLVVIGGRYKLGFQRFDNCDGHWLLVARLFPPTETLSSEQ